VLWCSLVPATQRLIRDIPRGVLPGQTKVDKVVNWRALSPGVGFRSALEIPIPIKLDWMEPIRIHSRRAEHDIVSRAIAARPFRNEAYSILKALLPTDGRHFARA